MKIHFEVTYDTKTKLYSVESKDVDLVHSSSSYLRIKPKGQPEEPQLGTIGSYCPGTEYLVSRMDSCAGQHGNKHNHIVFSIDEKAELCYTS